MEKSKQARRPLTAFGTKIKLACFKNDMTQKQLAERLGIAPATLAEIMRGARSENYIKDKASEILGIKGG